MRKNTHKKILASGCIATLISLTTIKPLPVKAIDPNEQKLSSRSASTFQKATYERELFAPKIGNHTSKKTFWYKCVINNENEKVYYKSKKTIPGSIDDLIKKIKKDKNFFNRKVKDKKEIEEIESLFDFEHETSTEESDEETKIKTIEEFKKLSKAEKAKYLASPNSDLMSKMSYHQFGPNILKYDPRFEILLKSRIENHFKDILPPSSSIDLENPESLKSYNECIEYLINLSKAIEKFMTDEELCEIYQSIYNILK